MTPDEIRAARQRLGMSQEALARAMRLGKGGNRIVRGWERGERKPSGPVIVALEFMLASLDKPPTVHQSPNLESKS
jgi:DNA-binding transcriptional regulator YiaG